jgi:prepilin-type N-terminal cleavage/methylation domain-containing protein
MKPRVSSSSGGFTLIELLAVLLILSILVYVLISNLRDAEGTAKIEIARQHLMQLEAAVKAYQSENGAAPPSSFLPGQEVGNDGTNVGIEALVVTLWSKKYEAGGLLADQRDKLINSDNDNSSKQLTDFDKRDLLEIPDPWGNPVAYIEKSDYALTNRRYLTFDAETGQQIESVPLAFKNAATGQYYAAMGFQLISAGPDGRFGTEDDITPFQRE